MATSDTTTTPFCEHCGGVSERVAAALDARDRRIELLLADVDNLKHELVGKLARIKALKKEQDGAIRNDKFYEPAMRVLENWKQLCSPNARELEGARLKNCIARMRGGYTEQELDRAVVGYSLKPFVVNGRRTHEGPKDEWRADAELIFRDAKHVDQGIAIAERADDLRQVLAQSPDRVATASSPGPDARLSPLGEAALRFARFGWPVFPCRPRDKVPATRNGLSDAKRDENAIRTAWSQNPHLNVAVPTGAPSGVVVLDVDGDEGWDSLHKLEDAHDELPDTASVTTPRGGQHFYFLHPGWDVRNTAGFPGPGLDVRGDGGYVLAPPSIGPGGRPYVVDEQRAPAAMPDWLSGMLRRYQAKVDKALEGATDWPKFLASAPSQGERNTRMTSYVGHLFAVGMNAREVYATAQLLNALSKPPLADKELQAIVRSIQSAEHRRAA